MESTNSTTAFDDSIETILAKLSAIDFSTHKKGTMFEILCTHLLREKDTANEYKEIALWADWEGSDGNDKGTDIVIKTKNDEFIAVQCKFFTSQKVDLSDLATYFTQLQSGVGEVRFSKGIIIATSDLTKNAFETIKQIGRSIPIEIITLEDLKNSNINWAAFNPNKSLELPLYAKKQPLPHQKDALQCTKEYFANPSHTRGKLIMACGTGKTYTSLKIIEMLTPKNAVVIFLAPSIALVGQTFREYCREKSDDFVGCIVCSDEKSGKSEDDDIDLLELPLTPSTRPSDIKKAYHLAKKDSKRFIIFSTYQSCIRLKESQDFLGEVDLMICDEAHRSVGAMYSGAQKDTLNAFTLCHSDENIKAKRRIYMTATPKIYTADSKAKGIQSGNAVFSMDEESIFGDEIYVLNFSKAIEKKLLTDYKVIILAIKQEGMARVANNAIAKLKSVNSNIDEKLIDLDFVCKIIGTHKGLAKNDLVTLNENGEVDNEFLEEIDKKLSTRAINFCRNIKASKNITNSFKTIIQSYDEELKKDSFQNLDIFIDHIDGTMNAKTRLQKLSTLNNPKANVCNILSNARCLSEGIDVPALDSVVFFDGRSAQVDIIQSVGRVMRKSTATQKEIGYIILPIALSEYELKNLDSAVSNTNFQSIWKVLKALRSHDETLVDESVFREKIKIAVSDYIGGESSANSDDKPYEPRLFDSFTLSELANTMYNAMPTKLGDKGYWQSFSAKTAKIVEKLSARLSDIFESHPDILAEFLASLRENIHPNIKESEAVEMICSHIITKPIFDALFGENINDNPIGKALDEVSVRLSKLGLDDEETHSLNALYKSVSDNAKLAKSEKSKQELIKNLYDTFFRSAFKKQAERLGIVYTPLEVVDFILHSTNALLKRHFGVDFDDSSVKVFDPFTGTGSFITRLLSKENALIADKNLKDKFTQGIFAQDIVLLAYYIALINITQMGQSRVPTLAKFSNIALCDSLDYLERVEKDNTLFALEFRDLEANKHIKDLIANENIKVIIGNPPYSGGATSANDNNANISHPKLEQRVKETYGKESTANLAKNTRDTLIQAIRMSSDRLDKQGIIGFVVNGGFIDSSSADGFRKCVVREFSEIYVLNLRGDLNAQMQGKKYGEGGNIFDKKVGVAIVFFVKDVNAKKECQIHYYDIGDYLSREAKLEKLENFKTLESVPFVRIVPNQKGDWINQRGDDFDKLLPLKSEKKEQGVFMINATGVATNREFWAYNFSKKTLKDSMQRCIDAYNEDLARFQKDEFIKKCEDKNLKKSDYYKELSDKDISIDTTKIAWSANLKNHFIRNEKLADFDENKVRIASTSPFSKQYLYFDNAWNERQSQFPKIFPKKESENILITTTKGIFGAFICDGITDLHFIGDTSAFPLYFYQSNGQRECAISDFALSECEKILGVGVEKEEIFCYIYALFHHKGFVEKYKFELCKEAPRISISKDFKALADLGRKLAYLHLNYENGELYKEVEFQALADMNDDEMYKVKQIIKSKDGATLHYNANISLKNIPPKAYSYKINGRSAIDIFIDRYQIKQDKASLISNNPNDFRGGKYIYELLCRLIVLCLKSVDMIEEISEMGFE